MNRPTASNIVGPQLVAGMAKFLVADLIIFPSGLLTVAFLTRALGPEQYGLFSVTAGVILWAQEIVIQTFNRATIKFIAAADDWRVVASSLIQADSIVNLVLCAFLILCAPTIAGALNAPILTPYLQLFSLELPLFAIARGLRAALTARGNYSTGALLAAVRWSARLILIVIFVGVGWGVPGAILGALATPLVMILCATRFLRLNLLGRFQFPIRTLIASVFPLFLSAVAMRTFAHIGLMVVQSIAGSSAAGFYSAAQNLTFVPANVILAAILAPLLSATTRALASGDTTTVRDIFAQATRIAFWLLPFSVLAATACDELTTLVYGDAFLAAGSLAAVMILGVLGYVIVSLGSNLFIAANEFRWVAALALPLPILAWIGCVSAVTQFGALGAAIVTTALIWLSAIATLIALYVRYGFAVRIQTLVRTVALSVVVFWLSAVWQLPEGWVLLKIVVLALVCVGALIALGEWTSQDLAFCKSLFARAEVVE